MTDDEREKWLEGAEYYGDAVENKSLVPVMEEGEIDVTVSFPAVKYDKDPSRYTSAKPEGFRQVYFKTFWNKVMEGYQMAVDATSDLVELKESTEAARDGASNVNAQLQNLTVTITDRNGVSRSVDIGFEIYRTYPSVAAMNADAANVPQGKFVIIATADPTSADNAKMFCKNSQGGFTFLSDLDQASAAAWAEWLDTMKPQIEAALAQAASDHTRAVQDHTVAGTDHTTAQSDHTQAQSDHTRADSDHSTSVSQANYAKAQGDYAKNMADHPPYIGTDNFWYLWNYQTQAYDKYSYAKGDNLDFNTMTEEEYEQLVLDIKAACTVDMPYHVFVDETLAFIDKAVHVNDTLAISEKGEFIGQTLVLG